LQVRILRAAFALVPTDPSEPPSSTRWRSPSGFAFAAFTVLIASLHGWAIWVALEGRAGLESGWPLWRDDHPLYFHSALVTRHFLAQNGTTAGYDPAFMAGYPKSVVFPASSTLPELWVAAFGGARPERAYKLYVFLSAAAIPWLIAAAARLWRAGPAGVAVAVGLFLVYVWTDFPINYAAFGMLPYLLAIPLGLVAAGAFVRYAEQGGLGWWAASTVLMTAVVLVHFTAALIVAPAAAFAYFVALRGPEFRRSKSWNLGVWAIPALVLLLNAFWWLPGVWLASTKGPSDFAFFHPEGVLVRLRQIVTTEPVVERVLCAVALLAVPALWRRSGAALGLTGFTAAGFFWGYLAGGLRSLDFLQPGRHTFAFYSGLAVAVGLGVEWGLIRLREKSRLRLDLVAAVGLLMLGAWFFGPAVTGSVRARVLARVPFLSSRPSGRLLWVVDRVKRYVPPGERLLYEEGGFGIPGVPDPFAGGRFSGLLPWKLGVELIGGPYLHAALTTNFTQFGEGKLFGRGDWDRAWFERYARLYRPTAILCWSPKARAFCRANPDLVEIKDDDGAVLVGRVKGFDGAAVVGRADVEAEPGVLRVRRAEAGVDGFVVLRYHSVPCLRADPPVAWEPVSLEDDPVPFIKLRPPPGPASFTLRFPAQGGPGTQR